MKITLKTTDKKELPLELPGAEPTVGELRTEAKRKLSDSDLIVVYQGAVLNDDAKRLTAHGIENDGTIIVVVKKPKLPAAASPLMGASPAVLNPRTLLDSMLSANPSNGAAASSLAAVPRATVHWAPPPAAAAAAAAPGAQSRANTDTSELGILTTNLTLHTTDKQELRVQLPGADPTVGELRTEAMRKLRASDLIVVYQGAVLNDDAKRLKVYGIEDGGTILILIKKTNPSFSPGAAASPAASAPPGAAAAPWAPSPAAAPYPPGAGAPPRANTDLFGLGNMRWNPPPAGGGGGGAGGGLAPGAPPYPPGAAGALPGVAPNEELFGGGDVLALQDTRMQSFRATATRLLQEVNPGIHIYAYTYISLRI